MIKYLAKTGLMLFSYLPSGMRLLSYRILGAKIGKGCYIGMGSYVIPYYSGFDAIELSDGVSIGDNVVICAKRVFLGKDAEIKDNSKITGETSFSMGDYSYVGENTLINLRRKVSIGNEAGVGANCSLYTHGVWLPALDRYPRKFGEIIIKNKAWVSANIFILPGVTIGENAVVSSGAVVTKDVADNLFVAGNPAKEIGKFDPEKKPTLEEKNAIALEMMHEFAERFDDRVKVTRDSSDSIILETSFDRRKFFIFKKNEKTTILYKKEIKEEDAKQLIKNVKNQIIISFSFEEGIKKSSGDLFWIDLTDRKTHLKSTIASSLLRKSLKNNGLRFESE
jgi:acetyltransferase-like isoleucine patch superfamily enzyme